MAEEIQAVVAKIDEIQKSMNAFATEEKVVALADQFAKFQNAKKAAERAERKNKMFGDQASYDAVANAMAKELVRAGVIESEKSGEWLTKANATINQTDAGQGPTFIPTAVDPVVSKLILDWGLARNKVRVRPGVHGNITINKRNVRVTVSGQTRPDSTLTPAGSTYTAVTLGTKEISAITTVEEKLIWDAPVHAVEEAMTDLAEAAAQLEDDSLFIGDASSAFLGFTGLKTAAGVGEVTTTSAGGYSLDNIINLQPTLHQSCVKRPSTQLYMHPAQFALLQTKKDSQNRYYFDVQSNSFRIVGYEVNFAYSMDSGTGVGAVPVILADLDRGVTMGLGRPSELRVLTERFADQNMVGIRLTYDAGLLLVQPTVVARIRLT